MEHTQGKWAVSSSTLIVSEQGKIIANLMPIGLSKVDVDFEHCVANAEYIVKCCNLFPDLVEALEKALPVIEGSICECIACGFMPEEEEISLKNTVTALLNKAKEK